MLFKQEVHYQVNSDHSSIEWNEILFILAQLLMEADPHSLVTTDNRKSSVFHYCCERKNDVLLASMLNLLRRLSINQSVRVQVDEQDLLLLILNFIFFDQRRCKI